jgi:hypothetical protein
MEIRSIRMQFYSKNTCSSMPIIVCEMNIRKQHHHVSMPRSSERLWGNRSREKNRLRQGTRGPRGLRVGACLRGATSDGWNCVPVCWPRRNASGGSQTSGANPAVARFLPPAGGPVASQNQGRARDDRRGTAQGLAPLWLRLGGRPAKPFLRVGHMVLRIRRGRMRREVRDATLRHPTARLPLEDLQRLGRRFG